MNILTPTEAAAKLGLTRQAFQQSVLPLLIERGEVRRLGRAWAIDGKCGWMWELYAATRKNLIEAGVWIARRPWNIRDLDDIEAIGMYEDYQPPVDADEEE